MAELSQRFLSMAIVRKFTSGNRCLIFLKPKFVDYDALQGMRYYIRSAVGSLVE